MTSACRSLCLTLAVPWGPHPAWEHGSGGGGSAGTGVRSMHNLFLGLFGAGMDESQRRLQVTARCGSGAFGGSLYVKASSILIAGGWSEAGGSAGAAEGGPRCTQRGLVPL